MSVIRLRKYGNVLPPYAFNQAIRFNGTDQYAEKTGDTTAFPSTGALILWLNFDSSMVFDYNNILLIRDSSGTGNTRPKARINFLSASLLEVIFITASNSSSSCSYDFGTAPSGKRCLVWTWERRAANDNYHKFYVDGVKVDERTTAHTDDFVPIDCASYAVGYFPGVGRFWKGAIGDSAIISSSAWLTDQQSKDIYNKGKGTDLAALGHNVIVHHKFDGNANDSAGTINLTETGAPTYETY